MEINEKEYCSTNGIVKFAGIHLIIELWNPKNTTSLSKVESIFREAVKACDATLLNVELHEFSPYGGVSGVGILKESHISIHSWPEYNYAALDIFVCGTVNPYKAIPVIKKGFETSQIQITEVKRGIF